MSVQLRADHVSKWYGEEDARTTALDNVSLQVKSGEFLAIVGASGSGKSTLMNLLGCLDKPSAGKYFFEGELVSALGGDRLAKIRNKKLGFIFQSFNLLAKTSATHNVELPLIYSGIHRTEREERSRAMLEKVGLGGKLLSTPSKLSGGEQQRVAIARALVNDPVVIFADEPTGNLDSKSSREILEIFKGLNREGRTIVMVTHETDIARQAKRIVTVKDGKIISDVKNKPIVGKSFEKMKGISA